MKLQKDTQEVYSKRTDDKTGKTGYTLFLLIHACSHLFPLVLVYWFGSFPSKAEEEDMLNRHVDKCVREATTYMTPNNGKQ